MDWQYWARLDSLDLFQAVCLLHEEAPPSDFVDRMERALQLDQPLCDILHSAAQAGRIAVLERRSWGRSGRVLLKDIQVFVAAESLWAYCHEKHIATPDPLRAEIEAVQAPPDAVIVDSAAEAVDTSGWLTCTELADKAGLRSCSSISRLVREGKIVAVHGRRNGRNVPLISPDDADRYLRGRDASNRDDEDEEDYGFNPRKLTRN